MDVDAVLARRPQVALVDELAHTNVPGLPQRQALAGHRGAARRRDHVISTVNIQHLESLNDVVEQITGVPQRETVPDEVVRPADQVELVDMTPEALRRRMAHGNIYQAGQDRRRAGQLLPGRQPHRAAGAGPALAGRQGRRAARPVPGRARIGDTWEARERVVVALTGGPEGETLIRRAARIAARTKGATCSPCTSRAPTGWPAPTLPIWPGSGSWSRASAARTTRWSATTSRPRCSSSRAA